MAVMGWLLGLGGLLPFLATSIGLWWTNDDQFLRVGVLYGAVILSFLGGIQWGFALPARDNEGAAGRLFWSVLPSLFAWGAVMLDPLTGPIGIGIGVFLTWLYEQRPLLRRLLPHWYRSLRHVLTCVVVACTLANGLWVAERW